MENKCVVMKEINEKSNEIQIYPTKKSDSIPKLARSNKDVFDLASGVKVN